MASQFGILTVTQLNNLVNFDLTITDESSNRIYSDDFIEAQISQAEYLVFGYVKQEYTSSTIPNDVLYVVREMAKRYMINQLIRDGLLNEPILDEQEYFKEQFKTLLGPEYMEGLYVSAELIDDYEYDS